MSGAPALAGSVEKNFLSALSAGMQKKKCFPLIFKHIAFFFVVFNIKPMFKELKNEHLWVFF